MKPADPFFVIGFAASAGGLEALKKIVQHLPDDFPGCILIIRHRTTESPNLFPALLQAQTGLKVSQAEEGDVLAPGAIFVARPGRHLLVTSNDTLHLSDAPKVKHVRPAADLLFQSMAENLGGRAIAVVLTGYDSDGSGGVGGIREHGGRVVAQHPDTAQAPDMPNAALATGQVDYVIPLEGIANALKVLVAGAL